MIASYSAARRDGRVALMKLCAVSIRPLQLDIHPGFAHSVSTSANPASLPPTDSVTYAVPAPSAESCVFVTSGIVAPEHARKLSA